MFINYNILELAMALRVLSTARSAPVKLNDMIVIGFVSTEINDCIRK